MLRVQLGCERWFNIELFSSNSHFCHSAYVTWSRVELWSVHVPARLSNFCCRTHFVRRDARVERSSDVTSCFQKWRKCLLKKCANGPFYDTKSPDYRDERMRANAWDGIGKELKIKRKFYVSSRDVRIVHPRLNLHQAFSWHTTCSSSSIEKQRYVIFSLFIPAVLTKYIQVWNSRKTQL